MSQSHDPDEDILVKRIIASLAKIQKPCGVCREPDAAHPCIVTIPPNDYWHITGRIPGPRPMLLAKVCCGCRTDPLVRIRLIQRAAFERARRN